MIVAVAEESRGAEHARQWIEQANAQYWCLIDADIVSPILRHGERAAGGWIDETGRIVRPPENAGSTDHFRLMDRTTARLRPSTRRRAGRARGVSGCGARLGADRAACAASRRGVAQAAAHHAGDRTGQAHFRWACGCAGMATRRRAMRIWRRPVGCIRIRGTSGARRPIWTRSARRAARLSGSACRPLGERSWTHPQPDLMHCDTKLSTTYRATHFKAPGRSASVNR